MPRVCGINQNLTFASTVVYIRSPISTQVQIPWTMLQTRSFICSCFFDIDYFSS